MNRIVLIGNGFDLAHGLKTSYADFIDWYWKKWANKLIVCHKSWERDGLCELSLDLEETRDRRETWQSLLYANMHEYQAMTGMAFYDCIMSAGLVIKQFSPLLSAIMHDVTHYNWVDIERIYYRLLCDSLKENSEVTPSEFNHQLAVLTEKLQEYLNEIQKKAVREFEKKKGIQMKIFEPIKLQDISIKALADIKNYFSEEFKN